MNNYQFVINAQVNKHTIYDWANIPNTYWRKLLTHFLKLGINGVGFQHIQFDYEIDKLNINSEYFKYTKTASYEPYHGVETQKSIAVFEWNKQVQYLFSQFQFHDWGWKELPTDELVFFADEQCKVLVVPYENIIYFNNISDEEINQLQAIDKKYRYDYHNITYKK